MRPEGAKWLSTEPKISIEFKKPIYRGAFKLDLIRIFFTVATDDLIEDDPANYFSSVMMTVAKIKQLSDSIAQAKDPINRVSSLICNIREQLDINKPENLPAATADAIGSARSS